MSALLPPDSTTYYSSLIAEGTTPDGVQVRFVMRGGNQPPGAGQA